MTQQRIDDLCLRLQSVPLKKVERRVGAIVKEEISHKAKIEKIITALDDAGIQKNRKPKALTPISEEQVQIVAWMAVQGTLPK